jgi:acetyl-CoA carboxylase biotin carboxyl carrier protein
VSEDVNFDQIEKLVELVEKHHLAELTVEENGVTITVKGAIAEGTQVVHQVGTERVALQAAPPTLAVAQPVAPVQEESPANQVKIESPMIGVFYRSPSPDAPAFIEVGETIEVGQTIGLIEAMKVFSEIPSEVGGVVVEIPAQNGKLVQAGETIVVVRVE